MEKVDPKVLVNQKKLAIQYCGKINPTNIEDYIAFNGFKAVKKVVDGEIDIISVANEATLVDRVKQDALVSDTWTEGSDTIVCPFSMLDNKVINEVPYIIIEGMMMIASVTKAKKCVIVTTMVDTKQRVENAISQATKKGIIGKDTGLEFFVEAKASEGLAVNAEVLANLVVLVQNKIKQAPTPGLKGVALGGELNNTGIFEIKQGVTYRQLVEEIGGGFKNGKALKAVKVGAPYFNYIALGDLDNEIDFMSLMMNGIIRPTACITAIDEDTNMVSELNDYMHYLLKVSCGKCFPCKVGTKRITEMVEAINDNKGSEDDVKNILSIAANMNIGTLCNIGQKGAEPVLSCLKYFSDEFKK